MKTLETIEHAQIEFVILIIGVTHVRSIDERLAYLKSFRERNHSLYEICSTNLKLKK